MLSWVARGLPVACYGLPEGRILALALSCCLLWLARGRACCHVVMCHFALWPVLMLVMMCRRQVLLLLRADLLLAIHVLLLVMMWPD